jgi:hypothetical protein
MRSGAITFANSECMRNQCVDTSFFTKVKLIEEEEIIRKQVEVHDVYKFEWVISPLDIIAFAECGEH